MSATFADRQSLASNTALGVGATWAGSLYWLFLAAYLAWFGSTRATLGIALLVGLVVVYPLGYAINLRAGGDLFARDHPWGGLVRAIFATELVSWPILGVVWLQAPELVVFTLATSLGAHFIPLAWIYRFVPYALLGVFSVLWASLAQLLLDAHAGVLAAGTGVAYVMAAIAAHRAQRRKAVL